MKNIQTINKLSSRDLNIKESIVEKVNRFYWKQVRRDMSSLNYSSIYLRYIGTFTISRRKTILYIEHEIKRLRDLRVNKQGHKLTSLALLIDSHTDRLRKLLVQRNTIAKQYYEQNKLIAERYRRIHEDSAISDSELGQGNRGDDKGCSEHVQPPSGGSAEGDNQETTHMPELPVHEL